MEIVAHEPVGEWAPAATRLQGGVQSIMPMDV
jgi:hypothetical protein